MWDRISDRSKLIFYLDKIVCLLYQHSSGPSLYLYSDLSQLRIKIINIPGALYPQRKPSVDSLQLLLQNTIVRGFVSIQQKAGDRWGVQRNDQEQTDPPAIPYPNSLQWASADHLGQSLNRKEQYYWVLRGMDNNRLQCGYHESSAQPLHHQQDFLGDL